MDANEIDEIQRKMNQIDYWIRGCMSHSHFLRRTGAHHLYIENENKIKEYVKEYTALEEVLRLRHRPTA